MPTPDQSTAATSPIATTTSASQKVLACILCQQRKVKCDRKFPCSQCVKSRAQCIPASTLGPRQRRRRFPEKELLDRLRRYEDLLNQNSIAFEPLHKDASRTGVDVLSQASLPDRPTISSPSATTTSEAVYTAKNFWATIHHKSQISDDDSSETSADEIGAGSVKRAWNEVYARDDPLLFGSRKTNTDLSSLHPPQSHIFKLWQIYLENVNPLVKVTHTPTLQGRIIDAACNVSDIQPTLCALMFGIYCMSILSIEDSQCQTLFATPRDILLSRFQLGCREALLTCNFLRTPDLECLTALFLYLVSVKPDTDPRSLSSYLGLAIRIAQRMGIHVESANAKFPPLEAEMRRRLWWSLVLFDSRINELADYQSISLVPTWDCALPLNCNDFDLYPDMKTAPVSHQTPTEALFAVVRAEVGEFVRNSDFHLDFVIPALKAVAKDMHPGQPTHPDGELMSLQSHVETKYLSLCNPENALQYMTLWTTRGHIARYRLIETYSLYTSSASSKTSAQQATLDATTIELALDMLNCDTKLMTSPLTKQFSWYTFNYFPFPAYIHLIKDLRKRPNSEHAVKLWNTMSENSESRFSSFMKRNEDNPFFRLFTSTVLKAWEARENLFATATDKGEEEISWVPSIVGHIRDKVEQRKQKDDTTLQNNDNFGGMMSDMDDFEMPMPTSFGGPGTLYSGMNTQNYGGSAFGMGAGQGQATFPAASGLANDVNMDQILWNAMDWSNMNPRI